MGNTNICHCKQGNDENSELNTDNKLGEDNTEIQTTAMNRSKAVQGESIHFKGGVNNEEEMSSEKIEASKSAFNSAPRGHPQFNPQSVDDLEEDAPAQLDHTPLKHSKKNLYLNMGANNQPLEVINELQTESFTSSVRISEEKKRKTEKTQAGDLKLELIGEIDESPHNKVSNKKIIDLNEINMYNDNKITETEQKQRLDSRKKLDESQASEEWNWKTTLITHIIPENKLLLSNDFDVMYQGVLDKIIENPSNTRKITYSNKFCVITKREFKCFKSKETFLHLQNPLQCIDLDRVLFARRIILPNSSNNSSNVTPKLHHFYLQMTDLNEESIREQYTWSSEDESNQESKRKRGRGSINHKIDPEEIQKKEEFFINLLSTTGRNGERQSLKSRRMSLLDDTLSLELYNTKARRSLDSVSLLYSKNILIFSSDKAKNANNWVTVINYFAKKN